MEVRNVVEFLVHVGPLLWIFPVFFRSIDISVLDEFSTVCGKNHFVPVSIIEGENKVTITQSESFHSFMYFIHVCLFPVSSSSRESCEEKESLSV